MNYPLGPIPALLSAYRLADETAAMDYQAIHAQAPHLQAKVVLESGQRIVFYPEFAQQVRGVVAPAGWSWAERHVALALYGCRLCPGVFDKRFVRHLCDLALQTAAPALTNKQRHQLWRLAWKYRGQLPDEALALIPDSYRP